MAPMQPHGSWYRHYWYADRSPRDTLLDRVLIFGVLTLSLVVGGMMLIRNSPAPQPPGPLPIAETAR